MNVQGLCADRGLDEVKVAQVLQMASEEGAGGRSRGGGGARVLVQAGPE